MSLINYEVKDRICTITLNRAEKRNALNEEMVTELKAAFVKAETDKKVKVIVLAAEGNAFCAGADLAYIQQLQNNSFEENLEDSNHLRGLFQTIYTHPKPVIAKVHGHAIAGGAGLATVCDFSFIVPEAKMGYTEVRIGFIPAIVLVFLLRKIGEGKAKELLLSGELITAEQASAIGLVNRVISADLLDAEVDTFAKSLVQNNSGESMARTKAMIAKVPELSLKEGLQYAAEQNAKSRATADCQKGISNFLNKEKQQW